MILTASMNSPLRSPASPARRPAIERSWHGLPNVMQSTNGALCIFVMSPRCFTRSSSLSLLLPIRLASILTPLGMGSDHGFASAVCPAVMALFATVQRRSPPFPHSDLGSRLIFLAAFKFMLPGCPAPGRPITFLDRGVVPPAFSTDFSISCAKPASER